MVVALLAVLVLKQSLVNGWVGDSLYGWVGGWMGGWVSGWVSGCVGEWVSV